MSTLLIGKAEEIDLLPQEIRAMLEHEGVYLCGDTAAPAATVPVVSMAGKLYSMKIDAELDPERFKETLTVAGPFRKPPNAGNNRREPAQAGERPVIDLLCVIARRSE